MTKPGVRSDFHSGRDLESAAVFIKFLKRLPVNTPSPVFLIVDGHPIHKPGVMKRFVEEQP